MRMHRASLLALWGSALAIAFAGSALARGPHHGEPPDIDTRISRMTERLELSGEQQEDIRAVMVEQQEKILALLDQMEAEGRTPELKDAMRETFEETRDRIEAQLSDEQIEKLQQGRWMRAHHGRRGCGGAGAREGDGEDDRL